MTPKISVVIPLYNKVTTVRRAILSIQAQGVADIEIVVVDDGSTDASAAQVEAMDDDRIILIRQANAGPGRARNAGAARTRASLVTFLDADDAWRPGFLDAALDALDRHPEAIAYCCGYDTGAFVDQISSRTPLITPKPAALAPPAATVSQDHLLNYLDGLHSSSTVLRRSAFIQTKGYFDEERCLWGEDSYLWGQILFMGPIFWDPVARINYHVEDSALGYAIKSRDRARPIAERTMEIAERIAPAHRAAFRAMARGVAAGDAAVLANSGFMAKSLALRWQHGLFNPSDIIWDGLKYTQSRLRAIRSRSRSAAS